MIDSFVSCILSLFFCLLLSLVFFLLRKMNYLFNLLYLHYTTVRITQLWMSKKTHQYKELLAVVKSKQPTVFDFVSPNNSFVLFWVNLSAFKYIHLRSLDMYSSPINVGNVTQWGSERQKWQCIIINNLSDLILGQVFHLSVFLYELHFSMLFRFMRTHTGTVTMSDFYRTIIMAQRYFRDIQRKNEVYVII